jgi:biopolymer transport protein ExbB/TolQ
MPEAEISELDDGTSTGEINGQTGRLPSLPESDRSAQSDGTNVSLVLTAVIGVAITAAFYLLLVISPLRDTYYGELFYRRSWVPYAIILLAAWAVSMLIFKSRKLVRQRDALMFDALPTELSRKIRRNNARVFQHHIRTLPCDFKGSFLLNRVYRALENFKARGSIQEVTNLLSSQAEIDANAVQSSYSILKVFIWAIPILGFIGTVIGISKAVGSFSGTLNALQDLGEVKTALGPVTMGLATAFDTTLLALVVSLLVMFPTSAVQKAEEDLLISVEEYCNENLLGRMHETNVEKAGDSGQIKTIVSEVMAEHEAEFRERAKELKAVGKIVTEQVAEGWEAIHKQLQHDQGALIRQFNGILSALTEERRAFVNQVKAVQDDQVRQFSGTVTSMNETANRIQQQITALQDNQVRNFRDVASSLAEDLKSLQRQTYEQYQTEANTLHTMAKQLGEALIGLKEQAKTTQTEITENLRFAGSSQQEIFSRLEQISASLTARIEAIQKQMVEADASRHSAAEKLLNSLADERQATARASAEQLAEISRVGQQLASPLIECQHNLSKDIEQFATIQRNVAAQLQQLTKSDSFSRKLFGIQEGLKTLSSGVDKINARIADGADHRPSPDDQTEAPARRFWQRFGRGGRNG